MDFFRRLFWRKRTPASGDAPGQEAVSWVVLSRTRVELDAERLRAQLDQIFPGHFMPPRERGSFVIDGPVSGAAFFIQSLVPDATGSFLLQTVAGPYAEVSDFADRIVDESLRRIAHAQTAWLSVELVGRRMSDDDAYRFIGRVLAHLAPLDAAALVHPSRLVTFRFDEEVRRKLASGERF